MGSVVSFGAAMPDDNSILVDIRIFEHCQVEAVADLCGVPIEHAVGALLRVAISWNLRPPELLPKRCVELDRTGRLKGLGAAMLAAGIVRQNRKSISFPRYRDFGWIVGH